MKAASVKEIKEQLNSLSASQLLHFCMRLAKYKKDNKELLSYLLFYEQDENGFILDVKAEIDLLFESVHTTHLYAAKKTIRKIIRVANKYARYSGHKTTELTILIYLIHRIGTANIPLDKSVALMNMYQSLIKKSKLIIGVLHEDLQYDFNKELSAAQSSLEP